MVTVAQRILDCLRDNGPIAVRDLPHYLREVDRIDLDSTVNRLMRQNSVSLELGKYDLVAQKPNGHRPFIATPTTEPPPSAADEAAANLKPPLFHCDACPEPHPDEAFRHRKDGSRYSICKTAHARKMGLANGGRKPDVPSNSSHTPPPSPVGSSEPPATSSDNSSAPPAHGTTLTGVLAERPEALSPVGAGQRDPLSLLARKRAALIARRELLLEEYETQLRPLLDKIDAIDQLMEQARRLCEEEE